MSPVAWILEYEVLDLSRSFLQRLLSPGGFRISIMTSSCNASLGRSPSPRQKRSLLVSIPRCWPWTHTGYKRRLSTISNQGYTDPNWASRLTRLEASLFYTIRVPLLSIRSRCQSIFYLYRSKPIKPQLPRTPSDLPFLRGSFELLVHDEVTWKFFRVSWSCETRPQSDATDLAVCRLF